MPWYRRWRNALHDKQLNSDLDSELRFHLAETTDRLIASGLSEEQAQLEARRRLGHYTVLKERTRDMDIAAWLDAFRNDLTYGSRHLRLNPGFAAVAILSLALGIGANTAIFQLLDATRLRGLPVAWPSELTTVVAANEGDFFIAGNYSSREHAYSYAQMEELRRRGDAFSGVLTFWPNQFNLSESGQTRFAEGLLISSNYLEVLGIAPFAGSAQLEADDKSVCPSAGALLGYGFWQREFGGNLSAIGKTVSLNGHRFQVQGIMPASFFGVEPGQRFDVALPLCADNVFAKDGKGRVFDKMSYWLTPIARLKPGWTLERAAANVAAISPVIFEQTTPAEYRPEMVRAYQKNRLKLVSASGGVSPLQREFSNPLWLLLAITGFVLLIACANLANLLLARASVREREIAVRQAVGASRSRLLAQLLTESLILAISGSALGLVIAQGLSRALVSFLSAGDPSLAVPPGLNWHVFGFLAGVAILSCLLFGLAPSLRASTNSPASAMHGARTTTASRERHALRGALVVAQVALSLVLLVAALLFGRSLQKLLAVNLGFDSRNILVAHVETSAPLTANKEQRKVVLDDVEQRLRSIGEARSIAVTAITPFSGSSWNDDVHSDKDASASGGKQSMFNRIGPGYLTTMGTPLLAGRDFTAQDDLHGPLVAIVNQAFAKSVFDGQNPVGRTFRVDGLTKVGTHIYQIVGLSADSHHNDVHRAAPATAVFPIAQDKDPGPDRTFVIRGRGSISSLQKAVESEIGQVNPNLLVTFRVMDVQIRQSVLRERLMANLSLAFGFLAACLSALGLYGVMSYIVARRRNEIGIRFALGATPSTVYRLVAKDAGVLVALGLTIGIAASLFLARYAESLLYELKGRDPLSLLAAASLLSLTGALATFIPARRAARTEPLSALRSE